MLFIDAIQVHILSGHGGQGDGREHVAAVKM